jgi:hypothetical protein
MVDPADKAFLTTLRTLARERLSAEHPCTQALDKAVADDDATAARAARLALHDLPADVFEGLVADAHKAMREDPAAILALWRGGSPTH